MSDSTYDLSQVINAVDGGGLALSSNVATWMISSDTSTPVLAFNYQRKSFIVHTDTGDVYIKFGLNASSGSFSLRLRAGKFLFLSDYGGPVSLIAVDSPSSCSVTEIY